MKGRIALLALGFIYVGAFGHPEVGQEHTLQNLKNLQIRDIKPNFDPKTQLVDVTGKHAFKPPGPNDQRGPCPGLNAMANHNYIPHDGIATATQMIDGAYRVFGLAPDPSLVLAGNGLLFDGNPATMQLSIGGPTDKIPHSPFSKPKGLSFSHNNFEVDSSPTRGDLYLYGDASRLQMSQFKELLAMANGTNPNYDLDIINAFYAKRLAHSKSHNPYFFHPPVIAVVLSAAYDFIYRLMSNKTAEHPDGFLSRDVLKSFYGVTGEGDNLNYTVGHERIPDNWYKRALGDEYNTVGILIDVLKYSLKYPQFLQFGGNTGKVNSFVGVDITNLTGGVYSAPSLFQGNNLACFIYQVIQSGLPQYLGDLAGILSSIIRSIVNLISNADALITCPQLTEYNKTLFEIYPGYTDLRPDGTYSSRPRLDHALKPNLEKFLS